MAKKFSIVLLAAAGLLLIAVPGAMAAMQTGTSNRGMPGTPEANLTSSQVLGERDLAGTLLSNIRAETKFSKLALKKSGNDALKQMAKRTISENNKLNARLITMIASDSANNADADNYGNLTKQAKMAARQMKKLKGTDFDRAYLHAMNMYGESSRKMIRQYSGELDNRTRRLTMRIDKASEARMQQLRQLAQSENLNLQ